MDFLIYNICVRKIKGGIFMSNTLKNQNVSDTKLDLILEEGRFISQYRLAATELLNSSNNSQFIYPIINLIHQTIELELKNLIMNNHNENRSYKELKIVSTKHLLDTLVKNTNIRQYYENIPEIECEFTALNKCVQYFYKLLGEDTFQKSRYAINKDSNTIYERKPINFQELKEQWNIYSLLSMKIHIIHIAYHIVNMIHLIDNSSNNGDSYEECEKAIIREIPEFEKNNFKNYIELYKQRLNKYQAD